MFEINKLIGCQYPMLQKVGWLLYSRDDTNGGLTTQELGRLLETLTVEGMEKECDDAYDEGFSEGRSES